jgi:hypothetical protein
MAGNMPQGGQVSLPMFKGMRKKPSAGNGRGECRQAILAGVAKQAAAAIADHDEQDGGAV